MNFLSFLFLFATLYSISATVPYTAKDYEDFQQFKTRHGKNYESYLEENHRMRIFMEKKRQIEEHNKKFENGEVTYSVAMNHFGDMEPAEFSSKMKGLKRPSSANKMGDDEDLGGITYIEPYGVEIPKQMDWRKHGAVTPIKDQGECGSCWAFSVTGTLEGQNFRKTGELVSLSEQNLIDCTSKINYGCQGGFTYKTYGYIKENDGIDTEESYPYKGHGGKCHYNASTKGANAKGFVLIPSGDENKLKSAVATIGPVSVGIDASDWSFQTYSKGIYHPAECSSTAMDHGVLVVGYGTTKDKNHNDTDYWIVKNSWGVGWGDNGYIHMARNQHNLCAIATLATFPVV